MSRKEAEELVRVLKSGSGLIELRGARTKEEAESALKKILPTLMNSNEQEISERESLKER